MKRHRTDGVSLTFGLIFLLIAGWWLIAQSVNLPLPRVGWIVAGGLILIGVLGLVGALRSGRREPPAGTAGQDNGPAEADASATAPDEPTSDAPTSAEPATRPSGSGD
ncbi:hypothetical protein O7621_09205 [Solwaraspora sp. WMMD937]|uniref:hypothetical protein n=1 Tax=Solwaraspora sp. WMMD937 TaxID=3016090 RepID=UPI00249AA95A|nr:hypothetical protein [Solwaraspora sp. WMMD937]WFE23438.1 hypothetical protein O7621_09205 [Solwaraspora sp. WMMD937]